MYYIIKFNKCHRGINIMKYKHDMSWLYDTFVRLVLCTG